MGQKQYNWVGIISLLKKVLGKEAITLLLLTSAFVFASPADALADTVYLVPSGSTVIDVDVGWGMIGSFTPSQTYVLDSNSHGTFFLSGNNQLQGYNVAIASSTSANCGTCIGSFDIDQVSATPTFEDGTWTPLTGVTTTLISGHTYSIWIFASGDELDVYSDSGNVRGEINTSVIQEIIDLVTRIVSVSPEDGEVVATSTSLTLQALINISLEDYFGNEDWYLRFQYIRQDELQAAVANPNVLWTTIDVPITSWPYFEYISATSSVTETGEYLYKVELRNPNTINNILSWWGLQNLYDPGLVAVSNTKFIVVERSILDQYIFDMASTTTALLSDPGLFEDISDNCNPISGFDALGCLVALFIPNNTQINTSMETAKSYILTKAPVGYATRVIQIMTGGATSSLPMISYTFGTGTALEGEEMSFDFNETLASANTILTEDLTSNTGVGMNVWEIFTSIWDIIVYGGLLLLIVSEVMSLRIRHK